MKTNALLLYGKNDLRLDELTLPQIKEDEILVSVISDSLCMSSYKAAAQGLDHKRVPPSAAQTGVMLGHEFAGEILEVGTSWKDKFKEGSKYVIQPAINYNNTPYTPGYSYQYCGGNATYAIMPREVMSQNCLLKYEGEAYFNASLAEPYSCVIGAAHASYHTKAGVYQHTMGIVENGNMAILAGAGPMGLALIDYIIHCDRKPKRLVVTDIDVQRLKRAKQLLTTETARSLGVELIYLNSTENNNAIAALTELSVGEGYDDVFVFAPVKELVEQADRILRKDGCLNFFAGPMDTEFSAEFNFYKVHYSSTHIVGTSGGNTEDMMEAIKMMEDGKLTPAVVVTHIGGLDSCREATLNLPFLPGGKKLIYTHIEMPLTAIEDFREKGKSDAVFAGLSEICDRHDGLWCLEAEQYLLAHGKSIVGKEEECFVTV